MYYSFGSFKDFEYFCNRIVKIIIFLIIIFLIIIFSIKK